LFLAERIPAQKLLDLELINKLVPHDQLLSAARQMTLQLIPPAGVGVAAKKKISFPRQNVERK
jgi:enoyl-CoA hydratase/carnithine racemase